MSGSTEQWTTHFTFRGKRYFYNRIAYNHRAERAVEIPLAFHFLATLEQKMPLLEVGNVLRNYENALSEGYGIWSRRIIDKFERAPDVENIDLLELPTHEKYQTIVSISTVEHVGQGVVPEETYGEQHQTRDVEAPLKAVAKIYDLLEVGGHALITVPFGKLIDGEWYIQWSTDYLKLLFTKFELSQQAFSVHFLRKVAMQRQGENPLQHWVEALEEDLKDVEYNAGWQGAGGIAVLELTKLSAAPCAKTIYPSTPLSYAPPILIGTVYSTQWCTHVVSADEDGVFSVNAPGLLFFCSYNDVSAGTYQIRVTVSIKGSCNINISLRQQEPQEGAEAFVQFSIHRTGTVTHQFNVLCPGRTIEVRCETNASSPVNIRLDEFIVRKLV